MLDFDFVFCLQTIVTAENIVIATGGRPKYPMHVSYTCHLPTPMALRVLLQIIMFGG